MSSPYDNFAKYYNGLFFGPWLNLYYKQSIKFIKKYVQDEDSFLDVGCGTGAFLKQLNKVKNNLKFFGIDESQGMIKVAQKRKFKNATFQIAKAESLPFEATSFNFISSIDSFASFDKEKFFNECKRILRPNGYLFINTIAIGKFKIFNKILIILTKIFGLTENVHHISLRDIQKIAESKNFKLIEVESKGLPYSPFYKYWFIVFQIK